MKITPYYWIPMVLAGILSVVFFTRSCEGGNIVASEMADNSAKQKSTTQTHLVHELAGPSANHAPASATKKNSNNSIHPEFQERFSAMKERRPNTDFDATLVEAAIKREGLWATSSPAKNLPLNPEEFTDGRQFIHFDAMKMETLMPGDNLKVTIDEFKESYEVFIDRVERHDYENVSWHGHIDAGDGQTYSASFTRGTNLTVGGMDTPNGNYVIQAHGTDGWIASSGLLFKADPHASDMVYPPEEEPMQ